MGEDTEVQLYRKIELVPESWDQLAPASNLFLQRTFLQVLENFPPLEMQFAYLIFFQNKTPIGIAIAQIQLFQANQNIQEAKDQDGLFGRIGNFVKDKVAENIRFHTLVCGNLLLTGPHGFYFGDLKISDQVGFLYKGLNAVLPKLKSQGTEVSAILIKEIGSAAKKLIGPEMGRYYQEFTMQPNMIFELDPNWRTFEDYVDSLSSKYRVRMKRAFKKAALIRKETLDAHAISKSKKRIHQLYFCLLYTSPSPRDLSTSRMPSSA